MGFLVLLASLVVAAFVYLLLANRSGGTYTFAGSTRSETVGAVVGALAALVGAFVAISAFVGWKPFPSDADCKDYAAFVRDSYTAFGESKTDTVEFVDSVDLGDLAARCG